MSAPVANVDAAEIEAAARELPALGPMIEEMRRAPAAFAPSRFWEHHNAVGLRAIAADGFEAFKHTINQTYFQWEPASPFARDARGRVARLLMRRWLARPKLTPLAARLTHPDRSLHGGAGTRWHALWVALLWELARERDPGGLLERLEEPELGGPVAVRYRGRRISEDLASSVLELATVAEAVGAPELPGRLVIELGAGYGRLAWVVLAAFPGTRYVVCDIPPALAIAERYLTELFPDRPALRFSPDLRPAELAQRMEECELAFLMPHQLAAAPALGADLFLTVSSLHEFRPDQLAAAFEMIDRHTAGVFFTKQWLRSVNVWDDVVVTKADYPVPEGWPVLLDRPALATPGFFEAAYQLRRS